MQHQYNLDNGITPTGVVKKITDVMDVGERDKGILGDYSSLNVAENRAKYVVQDAASISHQIDALEKQMHEHAKNLEFEQAAAVRDQVLKLRDAFIKA